LGMEILLKPARSITQVSVNVLIILLVFEVLITAHLLSPEKCGKDTHKQLGLPSCLVSRAFGIERCPSCGLTTSFALAVHGDLIGAWNCNHFSWPLLVALLGLGTISVASICKQSWRLWQKCFPFLIVATTLFLLTWLLILLRTIYQSSVVLGTG
jgi:hypothetical protein